MTGKEEFKSIFRSLFNFFYDIFIVYICFIICRIIFLIANYNFYEDNVFTENLPNLIKGAFMFDTSGIIYMNMIFAFMTFLPIHIKEESKGYRRTLKGVYLFFNSLAILANLCDVVYFRYTGRRTTFSVFREFGNEDNLGQIITTEIGNSWYLLVALFIMILILAICYRNPLMYRPSSNILSYIKYYLSRLIAGTAVVILCIIGMRGGVDRTTRPIAMSNANQFINRPVEAPLILNTPFTILRTWNKKPFINPNYFENKDTLVSYFDPLHNPEDSLCLAAKGRGKNVVVFIVESFGREYIGKYNKDLENGKYKGYTPFIDSLMDHSLWFPQSFVNGRKSIDAMPSVLSSIPYFVEPLFVTPCALNDLDGVAVELKSKGYHTSFFHGAPNGSMGFEAFAHATGFENYYGMTEFEEKPEYGGHSQFDEYWAIWDEPFLQYYCDMITSFKEPFMTTVFTASSHHPYHIPEQYKEKFPEEGIAIHKCIRYTDNALRRFFDNAKKQSWFNNTLFVICSDHTNISDHDEYGTDLGLFSGPIIFYAPGDETMVGCKNSIAQQIDIMPTILSYVGFNKPYIAFGQDLLTTPEEQTFAVSYYNGFYQYVKNGYFMQFDGNKTTAIYKLSDKMLRDNLEGSVECQYEMENELKAIIQQYMSRMNDNRLRALEG
ncbi:MAG: LTA synthase family protein [Bacteroidales bacterium]|nr:LTA synthase family protein [Bacteroidales bacterium]